MAEPVSEPAQEILEDAERADGGAVEATEERGGQDDGGERGGGAPGVRRQQPEQEREVLTCCPGSPAG